jgi:hypothetical protein
MGWRGRGGGRAGRWPGRGPFNHLLPWQRAGWLYGYGGGFGYRYPGGYRRISPNICARFPWLPRWWWANPAYDLAYPSEVDPKAELKRLEAESEAMLRNVEELKRHIEEGTPLPNSLQQLSVPYPTIQPENERQLLERQREIISYQLEDIGKRLEELEKEG